MFMSMFPKILQWFFQLQKHKQMYWKRNKTQKQMPLPQLNRKSTSNLAYQSWGSHSVDPSQVKSERVVRRKAMHYPITLLPHLKITKPDPNSVNGQLPNYGEEAQNPNPISLTNGRTRGSEQIISWNEANLLRRYSKKWERGILSPILGADCHKN